MPILSFCMAPRTAVASNPSCMSASALGDELTRNARGGALPALRDDGAAATESVSTHKPKVSTWGVFERPADISRAYGGGRQVCTAVASRARRVTAGGNVDAAALDVLFPVGSNPGDPASSSVEFACGTASDPRQWCMDATPTRHQCGISIEMGKRWADDLSMLQESPSLLYLTPVPSLPHPPSLPLTHPYHCASMRAPLLPLPPPQ
jgi:hypothetical protein